MNKNKMNKSWKSRENTGRSRIAKKIRTILLAAVAVMLAAGAVPGSALAQEENLPADEEKVSSDEYAAMPGNEEPGETEPDFETEKPEAQEQDGLQREEVLPESEDQGQAVYPIFIPVESGEQYEQLSAFLSLSADHFRIYMLAFVDGQGLPVQPEGQIPVSVDVPADYDMGRTVISEITLEGDVPQRMELAYTAAAGKAVFQTDHTGLFVIMEKKIQADLPPSLEMTDKVEKLELTQHDSAAASRAGSGGGMSVPKTGDQTAPVQWIILSAVVSAGLLLLVIAESTKNQNKS